MASLTTRVIRNARSKGCVVYTHRQWGSISLGLTYRLRTRYRPHFRLPSAPVDTLWQHISVTYNTGKSRASFKKDMRTLERIGNERFKTGVSYNFCWDPITGEIGLGQFLGAKGAHTLNDKKVPRFSFDQNGVSVAIAAIGMPGVKPTEKAVKSLINLIKALHEEGALTDTFEYVPHSLVAWKDCPTDNIRAIMDSVRKEVFRKAKPEPLRVGTLNIRNGLSDIRATADVFKMLKLGADVFGTPEVDNERQAAWQSLFHDNGYWYVNQIAFKKSRFELLDSGTIWLSPRTVVGKEGAGGPVMRVKNARWVLLKDIETGKTAHFVSTKLISSNNINEIRKRLYTQQITNLCNGIKDWRGPVFVTGDFNVNHRFWNITLKFKQFRDLNLKPNYTLGFEVNPTHGKRWIDGVWSNRRAVAHAVYNGFYTDHNGVIVRYRNW